MMRNIWKRNHAFQATQVRLGPSLGYVSGYYVNADNGKYVLNALVGVNKGADGRWRIASEALSTLGAFKTIAPETLIAEMDELGVKRSAILSTAFWYGSPTENPVSDEYMKVKVENNFVVDVAARFPDRLVPFCSFNPLKDYALEELERCSALRGVKGLKMHFGNNMIDVINLEHFKKLRQVFAAANARRMPIVVDLYRGTLESGYGANYSQAFLELLEAAPDIPIQIAHMVDTGPGFNSFEPLRVFAEAAEARDPRMKNVYFDVGSIVVGDQPAETKETLAKRMRQIGLDKIVWGTDRHGYYEVPGTKAWREFLKLPLTPREFEIIAKNVAPHMR